MSVVNALKYNHKAYNILIELCKEYQIINEDSEIDSLLLSLENSNSRCFTDKSDITVKLLCVIKILLAGKIGSYTYRNILVPVENRCLLYIKERIDSIPFDNSQFINRAKLKAKSLSTRSKNIILSKLPEYLFVYIRKISDLQRVISRCDNCGSKTYKELLELAMSVRPKAYNGTEIVDGFTRQIEQISDQKDSVLKELYKDMLVSLSIRSVNVINSIAKDYKQFVCKSDDEIMSARNCGEKSFREISKARDAFKQVVIKQILLNTNDTLIYALKYHYPFLNDYSIKFCLQFKEENGRLPILYILEQMLMSSEDRFAKIFVLLNGINCNPLSFKEIGESINMSSERVRQISRIPSKSIIDLFKNENCKYYCIEAEFITEKSFNYKFIREKERLDYLTFNSLINLICIVYDSMLSFNILEKKVAVSKRLFESFDFKSSLDDLTCTLKMKTFENNTIPIETFINPYILSLNSTCILILELYKDVFPDAGIIIDKNNCIIINSNSIDIENVLYTILKKEGSPLHIDLLFSRFKQLYPEHKYKESANLRPVLLSSKRICPQGKSSTYALSEWNLYSGTRRDYAIELLDKSLIPIQRQELIKSILLRFPESSEKAIASSLSQSDKIVLYNGDLMGLVNKQYPGEYIKSINVSTRKTFETRIAELEAFFVKYHYSPQYGGGFEEQSLYRWFSLTRNRKTNITEEQFIHFETIIEKYSEYCFNGDEFNFMKKCNELRAFISENYELPTRETNLELKRWFDSAMSNQFSDKRKDLLNKLLIDLSDYGFL